VVLRPALVGLKVVRQVPTRLELGLQFGETAHLMLLT
jgi:hypothetical protein